MRLSNATEDDPGKSIYIVRDDHRPGTERGEASVTVVISELPDHADWTASMITGVPD